MMLMQDFARLVATCDVMLLLKPGALAPLFNLALCSWWMGLGVFALGLTLRRRRHQAEVEHEEPLRSDLYSLERLEQHARDLAASHTLMKGPRRATRLLQRLEANGRFLTAAYRSIA